MSASDSMVAWIARLRAGDDRATARLWRGYYQRLVGFARKRLGTTRRGPIDEEDIASQALQSFFRRARLGSFPQMQTCDDLWRVLTTIAKRKVLNQRRHAGAQRRTIAELSAQELAAGDLLAWVASAPVTASMYCAETLDELLRLLDSELKQIALARLHGYTNVEIAAQVRRSLPTIERRLRLIRDKWIQHEKETL